MATEEAVSIILWSGETYLSILDLIVVHVLGAWGILTNILVLGELIDEDLGCCPPICLWESILGRSPLSGERQLSEGSMCLFRVEGLGKRCQV